MKRKNKIVLAVMGGLAIAAAAAPYLVPVPRLQGTVPPEELAGPEAQFIEVDGLSIHYELSGSGEPVYLLLHGFAASTYSWREVAEPLARHGRVLAIDRPGYGLTERIIPQGSGAANPYSVVGQSELLVKLLDALAIERVIAVGHSAGGTVALQFALDHPERVQALVLVDAAVYHLERRVGLIQPIIRSRWAYRIGLLLSRSLAGRAEALGKRAWYDYAKAPPDFIEQYTRPLQADKWDVGLWEATRAMQPLGQVERLGELSLPSLVISGENDQVVRLDDSAALAQAIAGARLVTMPRCGHLPQEECPEPFLAAVEQFAAGLSSLSE